MHNPKNTQRAGFTLVEIMIVVAIIALLATIAVPSWLRARMRSQNAKYLNDLRIFSGAIDTYAIENKVFPIDYAPGVLGGEGTGIAPFAPYLKDQVAWTLPTPIGGLWDIETDKSGIKCAVGAFEYAIDPMQMGLLDKMGDDGDQATGTMRELVPGSYYIIVEE